MTRIVSIGECMVELAPAGDGHFALGYAGDTFNTAWYLRRLLPADVAVDYLSAVGQDAVSDRMLGFMAAEWIGTAHVRRVPGRSVGLYLIQVDKGERSFAYWRSTSAARGLADDPAALAAGLSGVRLAYLSGITLAILAPDARSTLLSALRMARAAGTVVAFDPNIRPALWPDANQMRDALTEGAGLADITLPSFEDEARHFGDPTPQATAERYAALGAGLVVVKDASRPVLALQAGTLTHHPLPAPVAAPVDTTAAGDSFNAGLLSGWLDGAPLAQAVAAGASLAARVIAAPGALVRTAV
ncbi:sugar kinase [Tabrizicola aquatica]|uniref:sugar kinase n=1 Tax=Tabrizicola aquatica TaxID=909926 RepID=UPI000CD31ACC|nr:sugar kinase [Tabrizicola aquatica]